VSSDTVAWFGKHKGKDLTEIPTGYLVWMVENMDPALPAKYQFHEDKTPMTADEVQAAEDRMRDFMSAAEDEIERRQHHDQEERG
jgi:hypothetical protein